MGFFIHIPAIIATIFLGSNTNFNFKIFYMCFTRIKNRHVHTLCIHVYVTEKLGPPNIGPPNIGAIKGILTVKMGFLSTFQPLLQQFF